MFSIGFREALEICPSEWVQLVGCLAEQFLLLFSRLDGLSVDLGIWDAAVCDEAA